LKSNILGLFYSNGVRIGLEDNLYDNDKNKTTNIFLLKRIHNIINELGFNITKPSEFQKLGFKNKL
jgi:uncharacterized protein (DUF849 family)